MHVRVNIYDSSLINKSNFCVEKTTTYRQIKR